MAQLSKLQKEDYERFFIEKGEMGFSPERNKAVVEKTIREAEIEYEKKKKRLLENSFGERIDAVASYLTSPKAGMLLKNYFGKKELAKLRGLEVLQEIREKTMGNGIYTPLTASQVLKRKL